MNAFRIMAALALACTSVCAEAAPFLFDLAGAYNARFQLDSNSRPTVADDNRFEIHDVDATVNGNGTTLGVVGFFTEVSGGGFNIWDQQGTVIFDSGGPILFAGSTAAPGFLTGTFELFAIGADRTLPADYSLTISAVPEPGAWLTMILGFGMIGIVTRRRQRAAGDRPVARAMPAHS